MRPIELAAIAMHSGSTDEIRAALSASLDRLEALTAPPEPDGETAHLATQCAHAVGHLARRFGQLDVLSLRRVATLAARYHDVRVIRGGVVDMWDDLEHFFPELDPDRFKG